MAPRRNEKTKNNIAKTAFSLFANNGYENTSYSDIAKASGSGRSLIQYYYPKKENFISQFLTGTLETIASYVTEELHADDSHMLGIAMGSHIYFAFLLQDSRARRLTFELISYRSITTQVTATAGQWTAEALGMQNNLEREQFLESHLIASGGIYELLYRKLATSQSVDPFYMSMKNMQALFRFAFNHEQEKVVATIKRSILSEEQIDKAIKVLADRLFYRSILDQQPKPSK